MPYLQYVVPGILAVQAMWLSFGESTYARHGLHQVEPDVRRDARHAAARHRGAGRPPRRDRDAPVRRDDDLRRGGLAVRGVHLVVGAARDPGRRCSPASRSRCPLFALTASLESDNAFGIIFRFVMTPADALLRHLLPGRPAARAGCSRSRGSPRSGTASSCAATPPPGTRARLARRGAPRRAARLRRRSAGCSPTGSFTRRLARERARRAPPGRRGRCRSRRGSAWRGTSCGRNIDGLPAGLAAAAQRLRGAGASTCSRIGVGARRARRRRHDRRRQDRAVRRVRGTGAARGVGDERRGRRQHLQRVLQAEATSASTTRCSPPRSARATSPSARSPGR